MIEALIENEFWQHIVRFLVGSSVLLLAAWGLESSKIIQRFEFRAFIWKAAILGSLLLLLPLSVPQTPVYYLQASDSPVYSAPSSSLNEIPAQPVSSVEIEQAQLPVSSELFTGSLAVSEPSQSVVFTTPVIAES